MSNVTCFFCGQPVDPNQKGVYRKVIGWTKSRGSEGGANAITLSSEPLGWAHADCIETEKLRLKGKWQGTSLF